MPDTCHCAWRQLDQRLATAALLDELPNLSPCYKRGYCRASADYGNPPTTRDCQEFAL